jgi:hypothetical protein
MSQNSPKSRPFKRFFIMYKFELEHYAIFVSRKSMYICGISEVLSPQITKRLSPQIVHPQMSVTFAECPQIQQII